MDASRAAEALPAANAAPVVVAVFQLRDVLALILRLAASPNALLLTKRVARGARAVAPAVRRIIWQDRILKNTAIFKGHTGCVECCVFSPDSRRVATASGYKAWIWGAETGALLTTLEGHTDFVNSCAFSPDGKRIVTASDDGTARLWDAEMGALLTKLEVHADGALCCSFSPDGKRIMTTSNDETALLWDAETGALLTTLEGHTGPIYSCAISPDGERIVTASSDKTVRVWSAKTGALQTTLEGHTDIVTSCAFSPDGMRVLTASHDETARLWAVVLSCIGRSCESEARMALLRALISGPQLHTRAWTWRRVSSCAAGSSERPTVEDAVDGHCAAKALAPSVLRDFTRHVDGSLVSHNAPWSTPLGRASGFALEHRQRSRSSLRARTT